MSEQLKPCPFCGHEAFIQCDHRWPDDEQDGIAAFEVICTNVGCPIYRADNTYFRSETEAIEAWNSRSIELMYEAYGAAKMARKLGAITQDQFIALNKNLVWNGINNPRSYDD